MNVRKIIFEIKPKSNFFEFNLKEIWSYRDLLTLFIRRDFISIYKQTILGPLWFFIQPIITTITFTIIFGKVANIGTDGAPQFLFYLAGITCWNFFSICLTKNANTFLANYNIYSKVYFPRLVTPLSVIISNLFQFAIQFFLFLGFYLYFQLTGSNINPNGYILALPILIILMGGLGLGLGLIISSMVTKYRDLSFLIGFIVNLLMYATPIIYPLSKIPQAYQKFVMLNPMTSIIEIFKYGFFSTGAPQMGGLIYSTAFMVVVLFIGILAFNSVEKKFVDTV